jgi:hypothetical protein
MSIRVTLARCAVRLLAAGMLLLFAAVPAQAALIITAGNAIAAAGSSGNTLEVTLTNTGPSAVTIEGFSFGISTTSSGINFTSATTATVAPYIFDGNTFFGPTINTTSGMSLNASDIDSNFTGASVAAGATVGLGHVFFNVAPGTTPGPYTVTLAPFPTTGLSDAMGGNLPFQGVNGIITVGPGTTVVPEPSTLLLAGLGWPAAWLLRRRRGI